MLFIKKLENGGNSPTTYTMYGKTYNYDDFQRAADEGFNDYLSTLRRGEKDADLFREAYSNLMSGIKDGTITFENGHYHDSKGRYTNSKKKHKDYYGLVANYIYSKQGKSGETNAVSSWDGSTSIGKDLLKAIFNSETGNAQDFIDLDPLDEKTKKRGITNRAKYLADKLQEIYNTFDNRYQGYTAQDKESALNNIQAAITALRDGSIDSGDYLALSRAANGLDYRTMFGDGTTLSPVVQDSETPSIAAPIDTTLLQPTESGFQSWIDLKYKLPQEVKTDTLAFDTTGEWTLTKLNEVLLSLSQNLAYGMIHLLFYNKNYYFNHDPEVTKHFSANYFPGISNKTALFALIQYSKQKGWLEDIGDGNYYIPYSHNNGRMGWSVNFDTNKLQEIDRTKVTSVRKQLEEQYKKHFTEYKKNGGILKADEGTKLTWDDNNYNLVDWDLNQRYRNLYDNNNLSLQKRDIDASDLIAPGNKMYDPEAGGQQTEDQSWWNGWVNQLTSNETLAKQWAEDYLRRQSPYTNNYRSAWYTDNNFDFNKFKASLFKAGQSSPDGKALWSDAVNGIGHDVYRGKLYRIKGTETYDTLENLKNQGYSVVDSNPLTYKDNPLIDLYEVSKPAETPTPTAPTATGGNPGSKINPTKEPTESNTPGFWGTLGKALTTEAQNGDLVGAGRLLYSLRTNNRVAETIRRSLNPVLKDTYELYSPVTGAFSEMQFRNRQAANTRRLGSRIAASNSDASVGAAAMLDANRQAVDQEYQGFLADDREILKTQQEALKRQEGNAERRSEVANYNRASINATNRERAELEATRLKSNWQSTDNFLAGVEQRQRAKWQEDRNRKQLFDYQIGDDLLNREVADYLSPESTRVETAKTRLSALDPSSSAYNSAYNEYLNATLAYNKKKSQLSNWVLARQRANYAGVYGYNYTNPYGNMTATQYWDKFYKPKASTSLKLGGTLNLRTKNLINKVIHESNS